MSAFPRADYAALRPYDPGRIPVEIDLSDNTNLWGPHPAALARVRAAGPDDLRCYPEVYADTLRRAVAQRFGVGVDCVTTGAGSDDVLDSAFRAASAPGSVVAYPAPTFSMIGDLARMNGMRPRPAPWADAVAEPARLLDGAPALVYLCRPNNPTGAQLPAAWIERLLELRGPDGPLVVIDEAYADFAEDTVIGRATEHPRLLVARTCSKALGLAGLRCGFGVGRSDVVIEVEKARGPFKVSRLTAEVVSIALEDVDGWVGRTVSECLDNRDRLRGELERRGLAVLDSQANFLLVAAPSGSAKADNDALRRHGVTTRPFADIPQLGEGLRVTVGPWPLLERFLDALDRRLAELAASEGTAAR
jgi:histidinol-phosphate aminotransferase